MKKFVLLIAAAATLAGCQKAPQQPQSLTDLLNQRLEKAATFTDSIIAIDGTFVGGAYSSQVPMQGIENPDREEMLRGLRDVLGADVDNKSYLAGVAMGLQVINLYGDLSADEPVSKDKFYNAIAEAFRIDSISQEELQEMQPMFRQTFEQIKERVQQRKEAEVLKTEAAVQNRAIGEALAEKYQSNPDFKAAGDRGLMVKVIAKGDSQIISPNTLIVASIEEKHADTGVVIRSMGSTPMYAGRTNNPVLASVIPFMSVGETAEFFVPYELAYGVIGDETLGVGPCESVLCTVTIKPYGAEK